MSLTSPTSLTSRPLRATLLTALVAATAVAMVPPAAADHVDPLCYAVNDPAPCAAAHCENPWGQQTGSGVVPMTVHFVGEEMAIACDWTTAQPVILWLVVVGTCSNTVDYLADGHCDASSFGPYQPGPVYCPPPGPAGPGVIGATDHYADVEAYILCLALSMETGVTQEAVVDSCNNAGNYLFGRDMCFVI